MTTTPERPIDPPETTPEERERKEREREEYECNRADEEYDERNYKYE